jgi:Spy/CpxP family protein refolding chaperone
MRSIAVAALSLALAAGGSTSMAQAHEKGHHHKHRHGGLSAVAAELDVSKQQLKDAIEAARESLPAAEGSKRERFAAAFAEALGKTPEQVEAAFDKARESDDGDFKEALAAALEVDEQQLLAAFKAAREQLKADKEARRDAFFAAVASELSKPEAEVREAFESFRGGHKGGRCGRDHDDDDS